MPEVSDTKDEFFAVRTAVDTISVAIRSLAIRRRLPKRDEAILLVIAKPRPWIVIGIAREKVLTAK